MNREQRISVIAQQCGLSESVVRSTFDHLVDPSLAIGTACRTIRTLLPHVLESANDLEYRTLDSLSDQSDAIVVSGIVVRSGKRPIKIDGSHHVLIEGILADSTARCKLVAWAPVCLPSGEWIAIVEPRVTSWQDEYELHITSNSRVISPTVQTQRHGEHSESIELKALTPGERALTVSGTIVDVDEDEQNRPTNSRPQKTGTIADHTARLPFADWHGYTSIVPGSRILIENAYVKEYQGFPTVNLTQFSTITTRPDAGSIPPVPSLDTLQAVEVTGSLYDVRLVGTVIDLHDGTGLIQRCSACHRKMHNQECRTHGAHEFEYDLRTRAVLDDGTHVITLNCGTKMSETLYGGTIDEAIEVAHKTMDTTIIGNQMAARLLGQRVAVRGRVRTGEGPPTIEATELTRVDSTPRDRSKHLLSKLET